MTDRSPVGAGDDPLVEIRGLTKHFVQNDGLLDRLLGADETVRAVRDVDLTVERGETLGLVGESGSGKSTTARTLLRLTEPTAGTVRYDGEELTAMSDGELKSMRKRMQMVFQDPASSLNRRKTVGQIIRQPMEIHGLYEGERDARVDELMETVGLPPRHSNRYPHEFSGGQRQRVGVARALAVEPEFIVADEPVSALDVSIQAQILNLLSDLQAEFDLTILFIAHDLSVIRHVCDRVAVMYLGEVVELSPTEELFTSPQHPYTRALLEAIPEPVPELARERESLAGEVPSPIDPPSGCSFHTRCPAIVPPSGTDLDQATYREVVDLRQQVRQRSVAGPDARGGGDGRVPTDRFVDRVRDRHFSTGLPGVHRERVDEALSLVAEERWEAASDLLGEHYESPCEREDPTLDPVAGASAGHRAACIRVDEFEPAAGVAVDDDFGARYSPEAFDHADGNAATDGGERETGATTGTDAATETDATTGTETDGAGHDRGV